MCTCLRPISDLGSFSFSKLVRQKPSCFIYAITVFILVDLLVMYTFFSRVEPYKNMFFSRVEPYKNDVHGHNEQYIKFPNAAINSSKLKTPYPLDRLIHPIPPGLCHDLLRGSREARGKAMRFQRVNQYAFSSDQTLINVAKDCSNFHDTRGYFTIPITGREIHFPIAYSIVMHEIAEQTEILLKSIYRPQNFYCIHVDGKATKTSFEAIAAVAECFENVYLSDKRINVSWGRYGVLQADLICLEKLFTAGKWKYFINLTGKEFPLKTNAEIVAILQAFGGAVDVRYEIGNRLYEWRSKFVYGPDGLLKHRNNYTNPTRHIQLAKGPVHVVLSRGFAKFVLHNKSAREFLTWIKDTVIPDESFFASLNASPKLKIPGSYTGDPKMLKSFTRFKKWNNCGNGTKVHNICLLDIDLLPSMSKSSALFANKFHLDHHPLALRCIEEMLENRTLENYEGIYRLNMDLYRRAPFVKFHQ